MTTIEAKNEGKHAERAAYCDQQSRNANASIRASEQINRNQRMLDELSSMCHQYYSDYRMWAAKLEARWIEHPEEFCDKTFDVIEDLGQTWFEILDRMWSILQAVRQEHPDVKHASEISKFYRTLLSMRLMDSDADMPAHMRKLTLQAIEDRAKGRAEEIC